MKPESPGAQIHSTDPFATPDQEKSAVRRLRGRLASPVTLWTTPGPAGLTVSSIVVADGEPGRILGLIDDESDFWDAAERSGRFAVAPLTAADQQLADRFAGLMPAPGGLFATVESAGSGSAGEWSPTEYGPVPTHVGAWAGCRIESSRPCGWSLLVEAVIETIMINPPAAAAAAGEAGKAAAGTAAAGPLLHYRGRYRTLS